MNSERLENSMLEATGQVIAVEGDYAVIETEQRSACSSCGSGDSCGTSVLSGLFSKRRNRIRLLNHLNLAQGDMAVIGINESVLLTTAVMAYMLPLILMIAFSLLSHWMGFGDGISFVSSLSGLFVGMQVTNSIMDNKDYEQREIVLLRNANESLVMFDDKHSI